MLEELTIAQIKKAIQGKKVYSLDLVQALLDDPRQGVQKMGHNLKKEMEVRQNRIEKLKVMAAFDRKYCSREGFNLAGVDEVGRGPLAGPVVAAAVLLRRGAPLYGIKDSKALSPARRQELFCLIHKYSEAWGVGLVTPREIDRLNIGRASRRAMNLALGKIKTPIDGVLVDGNQALEGLGQEQTTVVGGDNKSLVIAAASIVAKVIRDWIMECLDRSYPGYGFAHNKGYGSPDHLIALQELGPCALHRFSFAPVREAGEQKGGTLFE